MTALKRVSIFIIFATMGLFLFQNCAKNISEQDNTSLLSANSAEHFIIVDAHTGEGLSNKAYILNSAYRWPGNTLTWSYNDSGRPSYLDKAQVIATLQQSASVWSQSSGVHVIYAGETTALPSVNLNGTSVSMSCANNRVVGWSYLTVGIGGVAGVCRSGSNLTSMGMKLNADPNIIDSIESLKKVAQHEFGHAIGLGDFDGGDAIGGSCSGADIEQSIMYGWVDLGSPLRTATGCDRHYSQTLYGAPALVCVAQQVQACQTSTGVAGTQTCNAQGTAWNACVATASPFLVTIESWGQAGDKPVIGKFFSTDKEDIGVFRPSDGKWYLKTVGSYVPMFINWGTSEDIPVVGEYFGNGFSQIAVFRPSNGTWYILDPQSGVMHINHFGQAGDIPVPGKYFAAENRTVAAVFRPSNGKVYVRTLNGGMLEFNLGQSGDQPVVGDFRGLGYDQIALHRINGGQGRFHVHNINLNVSAGAIDWGINGDIPLVGKFTSTNSDDVVVYRQSNHLFYAHNMNNLAIIQFAWGEAGDIPLAGRLKGTSGHDNFTVFRNGVWYIKD